MTPNPVYEPALFTLEDVGKRFNELPEYVLEQGALEFVDLIVRVPATAQLGVTNLSGHIGSVEGMRHPEFLKLSLPDISEFRKSLTASISRSPMGYQLLSDGFRKLTAHEGWASSEKSPSTGVDRNGLSIFKSSGIMMTEWTIKDIKTNEPIRFERSEIRVHRSEFERMKARFNILIDTDISEKYSTKLNDLYRAAHVFWAKVDVDFFERDTYPDSKKILDWFMNEGFSKSLAEAAVTIITPDGATTRGPKLKTKSMHKITRASSSKPGESLP